MHIVMRAAAEEAVNNAGGEQDKCCLFRPSVPAYIEPAKSCFAI